MNETLRLLYGRFYTPLSMAESEQKMASERNHYEENRHPLSAEEAETDACFLL